MRSMAVNILRQKYDRRNKMKESNNSLGNYFIIIVAIMVCIIALVGGCWATQPAHAKQTIDEISEDRVVVCLLGESQKEFESLLARAEAIRNKGTLDGVLGCRVTLSPKEQRYIEKKGIVEQARKAWRVSKTSNLVLGAQYWGSIKTDQGWIQQMEQAGYTRTVQIGDTVFYKEDK